MTRERPVGSLRRQLVLLTSAVTALGVVVLALLVQLILARTADNSLDNVLDDRADVVVGAVRDASPGTSIVVPTDRIDAGVAVYDATGRLVGGTVPAEYRRQYDDLSTSGDRRTVDVSETARLRAQPFTTPGGADGVVVVSEPTGPYEQAEHYAFAVSLGAGLLLVGMAAGLTALGEPPHAPTGGGDGPHRPRLERARPRSRASTSDRPPTSSPPSATPSTRSSTRWPRRSAPSSGSPPSWPTSCAPR